MLPQPPFNREPDHPEPVPFPDQTGPRQAGQSDAIPAAAPIPPVAAGTGNGRLQSALANSAAKAVMQESMQVQVRLQNLSLGAQAGLYDLAAFIAEAVGGYQQQFYNQTGNHLPFKEAIAQLITVLSQVSD